MVSLRCTSRSGVVAATLAAAVGLTACTQADPGSGQRDPYRLGTGALVGAGIGALAGALTGDSQDRRQRALVGAGAGALVGGAAGAYMDAQERQLREQLRGTEVEVRRVGDSLIVNVPQQVSFDFDSAALRPEARPVLRDVAMVLANNPQTTIDVIGHTDTVGTAQYNQALSERRARSVADFLTAQRVAAQRILVAGRGFDQPVASNATPQGRAMNRRVEIQINPLRQPGV